MLRSLDPHSSFFEAKEYGQLQERQKGQYYGLGITVQSVEGNITVVSPFEGTPAYRLGIRAGDVISKIEETDARGMSIDDAVKRLRGPEGLARTHHHRPAGLRPAARVHGDPRRDPPALGALLLHGQQERRLRAAPGLQRDHGLPARRRARTASGSWRRH